MDSLFYFLDKNIVAILIPISIIAIIILYFILKAFVKISSNFKIFLMAIITYMFIAALGFSIYYVANNEFIYSVKEKYYVIGRIVELDFDENYMMIDVSNTNYENKVSGNIKVKLNKDTEYVIQKDSSSEVEIKLEDLKMGRNVEIFCKEEYMKKDLTAIKVIEK